LGFTGIMKKCRVSRNILRDVVLCRLAYPVSKRGTAELLKEKFGISYSLDSIYRMMGHIDEDTIKQIQQITYNQSMRLLDNKVNVLFYDCTTLYFESFIEDELKQYGYSKDHKFNQSQVLLALMVTREGLAVGYEVFEGNCFEGKTLKNALDKIKNLFRIERVIFVADSALLSKDNLALLESEHIEYIVGARLRSLSQKWQNTIMDNKQYVKEKAHDDTLRLSDFKYNQHRRLITSHSLKRAEKDKHDREKAIERLKTRLGKSTNAKELISNYGYKKFIKVSNEATVELDIQKIESETQWDGLHGVFTNIKDLSAKEILVQYHGLWQVEDSFRINKHDLRMRPIFHWTPRKIKAHIAICYMAFALIRHMQYRVKQNYARLSAEVIRQELERSQASVLVHIDTKEQYIIPSKPSNHLKKLYQIMKLKLRVVPWKVKLLVT
jgi:transposase